MSRMNEKVKKIADFIVIAACDSEEKFCKFEVEEICSEFGISEEEYFSLSGDLIEELCSRKEVNGLTDLGGGPLDVEVLPEYRITEVKR